METRDALPSLVRRAGTPFGEQLGALQRQMDRLLDEFASRWSAVSPSNGIGKYWPALDMIETDDAVDITAELPGIDPKEVDVRVLGDTLTIRGEKKSEQETRDRNHFCAERRFGTFTRSLELPFEVDTTKVEASFDKGLLKVHIGKPASAKKDVKRIPIGAA